jgi:hypothetical protein
LSGSVREFALPGQQHCNVGRTSVEDRSTTILVPFALEERRCLISRPAPQSVTRGARWQSGHDRLPGVVATSVMSPLPVGAHDTVPSCWI